MKVKSDLTGKPYFKCVDCNHRKEHRCNYTRTSEMTLYEWCVYIRAMKAVNGLTKDDIEERSGVSIKTIERIMALNSDQDIMRETARRIEIAVCGTATHFPCYLVAEEEKQAIEQKLQDALRDLDRANEENQKYRTVLDQYKVEEQRKIDHLLQQINDLRVENERKAKLIDRLLDK